VFYKYSTILCTRKLFLRVRFLFVFESRDDEGGIPSVRHFSSPQKFSAHHDTMSATTTSNRAEIRFKKLSREQAKIQLTKKNLHLKTCELFFVLDIKLLTFSLAVLLVWKKSS